MNGLDSEYSVKVPGLAEQVATCVPSDKHAELLKCIREHAGLHDAKLVSIKTGSTLATLKVITSTGEVIAEDHKRWLETELALDAGDAVATSRRLRQLGYLLTECELKSLIYVHHRGGQLQDNFVEITVWVEDEFASSQLFHSQYTHDSPRDLIDLCSDAQGTRLAGEARWRFRPTKYSLRNVIDMQLFMKTLDEVERGRQLVAGTRRFTVTNTRTGESIEQSYRDMAPGFDRYPSKARRFFNDWTLSSAGRSGARLCDHWTMQIWDRPVKGDPLGNRYIGLTPSWTFAQKLAVVKPGKSIHALMAQLETIERRTKVPFAWYFFMLHANRVSSWAGRSVLQAAEDGEIVLPEHDYRILKNWFVDEYGF